MLLDLFPLNTVLFPGAAMPLNIFEPRYLEMVGRCLEEEGRLGIILLRKGRAEGGGEAEIYEVGTMAEIVGAIPRADGSVEIQVAGRKRFRVRRVVQRRPWMIAEVDSLEWKREDASATAAGELRHQYREYCRRMLEATGQWSRKMALPDSLTELAETAGARVVRELDLTRRAGDSTLSSRPGLISGPDRRVPLARALIPCREFRRKHL